MADFTLNCAKRESVGKNKVNKLRTEKIIPGIVYSKGDEPIPVQVEERDLAKVYREAGTSNIVFLMIDGERYQVLFKDVQKHPFKNQFVHVDFLHLKKGQKLRVNVPIVLEGRDEIRVQPSVLMQTLNEIEVECTPANIPNEAVVSVEEMQIGDNIFVSDLDIFNDENIEILTPAEELIAALSEPREEVIEETDEEVAADAADVPTVDETKETDEEDAE